MDTALAPPGEAKQSDRFQKRGRLLPGPVVGKFGRTGGTAWTGMDDFAALRMKGGACVLCGNAQQAI